MHLACAACGLDPNTGSFLVQVAQAAVIMVPFVLRGQIVAAVRSWRLRLLGSAPGEACLIEEPATGPPGAGDDAPKPRGDL